MMKPEIVTVADEALPDAHKVADELAAKGMRVSRVMPVTGVMSVEEEAVARLPSPDSPLQ